MTGRGARIGMATAVAALALAAVPARAACELHVTAAGYPNRTIKPNAFVKVAPPPPGGAVFTTARVAAALDDAALRALMPGARELSIVRHEEVLDLDRRKLGGTRLYPGDAPCYADLVVDNTYAILTDEVPQERLGVIGAAIVGGSRLVTSFALNRWRGDTRKPASFRKKFDSPVAATVAEVNAGTERARTDLVEASNANLRQFAEFVAARTSK